MDHDKLVNFIDDGITFNHFNVAWKALKSVIELHREDHGTPDDDPIWVCDWCKVVYPCPTIKAITEVLNGQR